MSIRKNSADGQPERAPTHFGNRRPTSKITEPIPTSGFHLAFTNEVAGESFGRVPKTAAVDVVIVISAAAFDREKSSAISLPANNAANAVMS